jgi:predicted nuclease of predicted toxin-antitoxin system
MVPLAFDENFNNDVVRGMLRRSPSLDTLRVQDAGLQSGDDPTVLAWAATEGRVLVSHDVSTLTAHAYARVRAGQPMPGLVEAGPTCPWQPPLKTCS